MTPEHDTLPAPIAPVPVSGYTAWFIGRDDQPVGLPVFALIHRWACYGPDDRGEQIVDSEWEPAVLSYGGSLVPVWEADNIPAMVGAVLVGLAPSTMTSEAALGWLEHQLVMPDSEGERAKLGAVDCEGMVGRLTAARMRLNRRLTSV